jgi:hypothetical protein
LFHHVDCRCPGGPGPAIGDTPELRAWVPAWDDTTLGQRNGTKKSQAKNTSAEWKRRLVASLRIAVRFCRLCQFSCSSLRLPQRVGCLPLADMELFATSARFLLRRVRLSHLHHLSRRPSEWSEQARPRNLQDRNAEPTSISEVPHCRRTGERGHRLCQFTDYSDDAGPCGWIVSPRANIPMNFSMRLARVSIFFAPSIR